MMVRQATGEHLAGVWAFRIGRIFGPPIVDDTALHVRTQTLAHCLLLDILHGDHLTVYIDIFSNPQVTTAVIKHVTGDSRVKTLGVTRLHNYQQDKKADTEQFFSHHCPELNVLQ